MSDKKLNLYIFRTPNSNEYEYINSLQCNEIFVLQGVSFISSRKIKVIEYEANIEMLWKKELLNFTNLKVGDSQILDFFSYRTNGPNTWFYNKFKLYYNKIGSFAELKILSNRDTKKMNIVFTDNLNHEWFEGMEDILVKVNYNVKRRKQKIFKKLYKIIALLFVFSWRVIISSKKCNREKAPFVLTNYIQNYTKTEYKNDIVFDNKVWSNLFQSNKEEFTVIEEGEFMYFNKIEKFSRQNFKKISRNTITTEFLIFLLLLKPLKLKKAKSENEAVQNNLKKIYKNLSSPVERMIVDFFLNEHKLSFLYLLKFYAYSNFFKNANGIKSVLAYSENTSSGKVILDAAKKEDIVTIGVQHGIINEKNIAYNFSDIEHDFHCIPDYTFVWGENAKKKLIEFGNYTSSKCVVTGQIRSDSIHFYKERRSRDDEKFNLCFFTQPQPNEAERKFAASEIIKAASEFAQCNLLLKVHPAEDSSLYLDLINKLNLTNVKILDGKTSLYKVLSTIELAITCYSTVGQEALLFDLPLVIFDSNSADKGQYLKNKVGYHCKNSEEVKSVIKKLVSSQLEPNFYDEVYSRNSFRAIDGKSSQRCMDFLRGL